MMLVKPRARTLELAEKRNARRRQRARVDRMRKEAKQFADAAIRVVVFDRDKGRCRACGQRVFLRSRNPLELAHCHHVVYRSALGSDQPHNRLTLCATCHDDEHRHVLIFDGEPNGTIACVRRNPRTQEIEREWESPCP